MCTPNYKPPDVCLGNRHYRDSLDMWAFGLLAAEIHSGDVLVVPVPAATAQEAQHPITYFEGIVKILPSSNKWPPHTCLASWLEGLPFFKKWYRSSQEWLRTQARGPKPWPPLCLEGCPEGLDQLISNCLVWHPCARMTATEAKKHLLAAAWSLEPACQPGPAERQEWPRNCSAVRPRPRSAPLFASVPELEGPCHPATGNARNRFQLRRSGGGGTAPQNRDPRLRG